MTVWVSPWIVSSPVASAVTGLAERGGGGERDRLGQLERRRRECVDLEAVARIWSTRLPTPGTPGGTESWLSRAVRSTSIDTSLMVVPSTVRDTGHVGRPDHGGVVDPAGELLDDAEPGEGVLLLADAPLAVGGVGRRRVAGGLAVRRGRPPAGHRHGSGTTRCPQPAERPPARTTAAIRTFTVFDMRDMVLANAASHRTVPWEVPGNRLRQVEPEVVLQVTHLVDDHARSEGLEPPTF